MNIMAIIISPNVSSIPSSINQIIIGKKNIEINPKTIPRGIIAPLSGLFLNSTLHSPSASRLKPFLEKIILYSTNILSLTGLFKENYYL